MDTEIGAFEARTHLLRLLERVRAGERFVITRHGQPVAELVPFRPRNGDRIEAAIELLKDFRAEHTLGGISVRELIEDNRHY